MANADLDKELLQKRLLGWGLRADLVEPGVSLVRDLSFAAGDLAWIEGMPNLLQDLSVALTTALGDDPFNVGFGFDGLNALAEESNPTIARERMRMGVVRVVKRDARVARVAMVSLDGDSPLTPPPPGSRELEVRVEFETIVGDRATADFGKVVQHGL